MKKPFLLFFCLIVISCFTFSQEQYGNIRGVVVDEQGKFDKALAINPKDWWASFNKGDVYFYQDNFENEFYLKGRMTLKRENYPEAVENLEKAVSALQGENPFVKLVHALYMDSLASAYTQNGDIDKAIKTYEKISLLTCGRFLWGDIYAKSFYNLGKLYEERGWKGKAIESYQKFLNLWKEADPGIAEVEDAKEKLVALQSR